MMLKSKKGKIQATLQNAIITFVLIIAMFQVYASLVPVGQAAGDDLQESGVPIGPIFGSQGFVWILVMISLLILVVKNVIQSK